MGKIAVRCSFYKLYKLGKKLHLVFCLLGFVVWFFLKCLQKIPSVQYKCVSETKMVKVVLLFIKTYSKLNQADI